MVVMKYLKYKPIFLTKCSQSPILIFANRILTRVSFRIKGGYKLELLTNQTMKLLGDGPIIDTTKNGENVPKLEIVRNVLVFCSLV